MPSSPSSPPTPVAEREPEEPRTYAITGGRTQVNYVLRLETQVMPAGTTTQLSAESAQVLAACGERRSVSVAEIAAALNRPLWAVKVLIGDLLDIGALLLPRSVSDSPGQDPAILRLVLAGLKRQAQQA